MIRCATPGVASAGNLDLEVSREELEILREGDTGKPLKVLDIALVKQQLACLSPCHYLQVIFPFDVDEDSVSAKFDKVSQ